MVTGGAGKLSVHSRDEVILGSLEHSKIGLCQGQQRGGHCLQTRMNVDRKVTSASGPHREHIITPAPGILSSLCLLHPHPSQPPTHLDILVLLHVLWWVLRGDTEGRAETRNTLRVLHPCLEEEKPLHGDRTLALYSSSRDKNIITCVASSLVSHWSWVW